MRVRRTTSDDDDAERKRRRALKSADSATGRVHQQGTTVLLQAFVYKDSKLEVNSLRVMRSYTSMKETPSGSRVHHRLEPLQQVLWDSGKGGIAVVQPCQNERCC